MASGDRGRRTDAAVRLGSGRQLGFAECGEPGGAPVLVFHPAPGSRRLALSSDAVARELGVRLICLERPGFGLSDYQPGRTLAGWPVDVAEFADVLGLGTFAVAGLAGGGPYALACGYRIPHRLAGIGVVAGLVPPELYRHDPLMALVAADPDRARSVIYDRVTGLARDIEGAVSDLAALGGPDGDVYRRPEVRAQLVATGREALRSGTDGLVTDIWLHCHPWGFPLHGIGTPVHWWHGELDGATPVAAAERAVTRLPHGTLTVFPGEGHAIGFDHGDEVLATLAGRA